MTPDFEPELVLEGEAIVRRSSEYFQRSSEGVLGFFSAEMGSAPLSVCPTFSLLLRYSP